METKSFKGFIYAALAAATFGLIPLFANTAIQQGVDNDTILAYRYSISAIAYGIFLAYQRKDLRINRTQTREVILAGVFGYGITATFLLGSYLYMPTGIATSIHFFYPVVVCILMAIFYKTKTPARHKFAIGISIIGVAMLSWTEGEIQWLGLLLALLSTLTYGGYMVALNRPALKSMDPSVLTFWALAGSAVFYILSALIRGHLVWIESPRLLLDMVLLGVLSTTVSARLTVAAVKSIGSVSTSIFGTLEPITAILTGIIVFDESFGWMNLGGFILITLSVILVLIPVKTKPSGK